MDIIKQIRASGFTDASTLSWKPTRKRRRAVVSGIIGISVLTALAWLGGDSGKVLHLSVPGPVVGMGLLALILLLAKRFHTRSHRHLTLHVMPAGRLLIVHLALLFVPAGVGIVTEGEAMRREWLPLVAGVAGSTFIGLVATGWLMNRFAPKITESNS